MQRSLSMVRENTDFATPPCVLVMAEEGSAGEALALADALDRLGAETEIRFGDRMSLEHVQPDAVILLGPRGHRITRHHPVLDSFLMHITK